MGNGMNKIIPGLYVGNIRDSKDENQLKEHNITHILSIHDNAKPLIKGKKYLCIAACDNASQDLLQYFPMTNDFIHDARVNGGNVLVHCLAGVSRSVTVTVAYIMTITSLEWRDALNAVRGARRCANPNFGFQRQLVAFQHDHLPQAKKRLSEKQGGSSVYDDTVEEECRRLMAIHHEWVLHGDKGPEDVDTYCLPHNAYGKKLQSSSDAQGSETSQGSGTAELARTGESCVKKDAPSSGNNQNNADDTFDTNGTRSTGEVSKLNENSTEVDSQSKDLVDDEVLLDEMFDPDRNPRQGGVFSG